MVANMLYLELEPWNPDTELSSKIRFTCISKLCIYWNKKYFYTSLILFPESSGCGSPIYKDDDSCDDENNNFGCNWDGGACCGDNVNKNHCNDCECLDPNFQGMYVF